MLNLYIYIYICVVSYAIDTERIIFLVLFRPGIYTCFKIEICFAVLFRELVFIFHMGSLLPILRIIMYRK